MKPRRADIICCLIIVLASLAWYSPALLTGRVLLPADIVLLMRPWSAQAHDRFPEQRFAQNQMHGPIFEYYSWRETARQRLRQGEVPLWNPNELSGNVLLGNSQSAVLYPPNILLWVLPLWVGINLVTLFHTIVTGLAHYALLRKWKLGPIASLTGAAGWMFSGLQIVWTEFQTPTAVLCWLPVLWLCWEGYHQSRGRVWLIAGSLGVAMTLLAGHLQFAFYVLLSTGLFAAARTIIPDIVSRKPASLVALVSLMAVGGAVSACTMLPVAEMARINFRSQKPDYSASVALRIPPVQLFGLIQPNLFGSPRDYMVLDPDGKPQPGHDYWGSFDYIEYTAYPSVVIWVLGLTGVWVILKRRLTSEPAPFRIAGVVGALGLLMALGTPICLAFYYGVPGYAQFNATARALCLFAFALPILAAVGCDVLLRDRQSVRTAFIASGVVFLVGLTAYPGLSFVFPRMAEEAWKIYMMNGARNLILFLCIAFLALYALSKGGEKGLLPQFGRIAWPGLVVADLAIAFYGFNPVTDPGMLGFPTRTTDLLASKSPDRSLSLEAPGKGIKGFIVPNYNSTVGVREVQGADSLHTRRYHRLMEAVVGEMDRSRKTPFPDPNTLHLPGVNHPMMDLLNVRWVTQMSELAPSDPTRLKTSEEAELRIWENSQAMGKVRIVNRAIAAPNLAAFMDYLHSPDFQPHTAAVEGTIPDLTAGGSGSANITLFAPHEIAARVESTGRTMAVFSEVAYPGWRVTVDNVETDWIVADHILRGVVVEPGAHTVVWRYSPASYRVGLFITLATLAGLMGACVGGYYRKLKS